ncbi:hypothetical protein BLL52_1803 [Rhodoferax antarcticus ANT.BR]|uniref:Uncharacterized protein n=1 Tax=Rhodoferax antarcticus ANT.BR TaxID=1111071 RepID=A0A1Q8YGC9_9BURK|nr:hypothetical protein BLL52_1803 [Rhodoferax antarcticus ANT.BR]
MPQARRAVTAPVCYQFNEISLPDFWPPSIEAFVEMPSEGHAVAIPLGAASGFQGESS